MMFDSAQNGSKWVCPNDRGLTLLAKVGAGWSMKTQHNHLYKQPVPTLDDSEQQVILSVVKRADTFETEEQDRIGRLVDRLDNMKKNTISSGRYRCVLCGANCILLGMFATSSILCHDCRKTVCQKCGIETYSHSRKEQIRRCKICAETREMWKKSGAWFFKAVPKHTLPVKKSPIHKKYYCASPIALEKSSWYQTNTMKTGEVEEDSSSDEDRMSRMLVSRPKLVTTQASSSDKRSPAAPVMESLYELKEFNPILEEVPGPVLRTRKVISHAHRRDTSESSESGSSGANPHLPDDLSYPSEILSHSHSRQDSQFSLRDWSFDCDRDYFSLSGSSLNGLRPPTTDDASEASASSATITEGTSGCVELSLVYDSAASSILVYLHRAKNLKPMDINGLADPFCKLNLLPEGNKCHRLRTRIVHKTRNPEFNETLTFYGVTENDLAMRSLHILVLDDDKFGHGIMGEARFLLSRLQPDLIQHLNLSLENHYPVDVKEEAWGEEDCSSHGQILITLCYSTRRKAIIVGIVRCTNLLPMDSNGFSDPFIKLCLRPDHFNKKYKTSVKWKNLNPVFNEEFAFETKMTDLPQQTLVLTVWDKDYGKSNDYLGCLELGCKSKGERLRHWTDMIKFPDHKHEGWHNLCDDPPPH